jgi:predicted RNA-binding Zn-ribbon protein involved in translation (DUF1610 family)
MQAEDTTPGAYVGKPCPNCGASLNYSYPTGSVKVGWRILPTLITSRYIANCLKCGWDEEAT